MRNNPLMELKCNCGESYFVKNSIRKLRCKKCNNLIIYKKKQYNKICLNCGKEFVSSKENSKFCCYPCKCEYQIGKHNPLTESGRETLKQLGKKFDINYWMNRKPSSRKKRDQSHSKTMKKKFENGYQNWNAGETKETDIRIQKMADTIKLGFKNGRKVWFHEKKKKINKLEKALYRLLKKNNINYDYQKQIFYKDLLKTYPDAFIKPNICLYTDGDYWHGNPKFYNSEDIVAINQKAKDCWIKDEYITKTLKKLGYKVLRIWESDFYKNKQKFLKKILKTIPRQSL